MTENANATPASLPDVVSSLYQVRQQKSALEKTEKVLLEQLKTATDPQFDKLVSEDAGSKVPLIVDQFSVFRTAGTSRTISGDLLLERGVAPDIINYATKTTIYFRYQVKETGGK